MKLPFSNSGCRLPIADCPANSQIPIFNRKSQIANHKFQRGVALIITLILLAVVTVMAVAFLANSRRERGSVTTSTDTAGARLAADAALAQAEAQIMASVLATTNPYNFGLLVSTNYVNSFGFQTGIANPTNVNYWYANGNSLNNPGDIEQNIANLLYSPRAPVFVPTNPPDNYSPNNSYDFRYYLDLNRNGVDDPNYPMPETNSAGLPTGNIVTNVGDPEWIGVLDHPDQPHGPNNRFIARYAFVAVPIGNALDLNAIYNDATRPPDVNMNAGDDGFLRNQGVGSWEINLAAFLTDLNTNQWDPPTVENAVNNPYLYDTYSGSLYNSGAGFDDALSLLKYRYGGTYNNLFWVQNLFSLNGQGAFLNNIDVYSDGPLMTSTTNINVSKQNLATPWSGSDNTNHFFDIQELFANPNNTFPNFTNRLLNAGNGISTYDRYTFYRLMSQMGVASAPEQDKMNLNYDNLDPGLNGVLNVNGTASATNFVPWTALGFFTNAADRMLRAYSQDWLTRDPADYVATYFVTNAFGITDIPVLVSNQFVYSSAINRVLQLAANMYDATTNTFYPSVFRPVFWETNDNGYNDVYIGGFVDISTAETLNTNGTPPLDLPVDVTSPFLTLNAGVNDANGNVYGVPWIIGAKKGFPNFNEFSMEEAVGVTRRLQFTRQSTNAPTPDFANFHTNEMYTMCITNSLGVECWNSYAPNFLGSVQIVVRDNLSMILTNDDGMTPAAFGFFMSNSPSVTPFWSGSAPWVGGNPNTNSFQIPLQRIISMPLNASLTASSDWWVYRSPLATAPWTAGLTAPCFVPDYDFNPETGIPLLFETNVVGFPFPHFGLLTTNRLQVFMLDFTNGFYHVIDYAHFAGPDSSLDIYTNLFTDTNGNVGVWNANPSTTGVPDGVANQIQISRGQSVLNTTEDGDWNPDPEAVPLGADVQQQQAFFDGFFEPGNIGKSSAVTGNTGGKTVILQSGEPATNLDLSIEAPYEPTRFVVLYTTWQANDPLVHYVASDLNYTGPSSGGSQPGSVGLQPGTNSFNYGQTIPILPNLGQLNDHYTPWGGHPAVAAEGASVSSDTATNANATNPAVKDPLVYSSDNWDFPTNKFPTVGWLGRVHRGTPWQTVDLKSTLPSLNTWTNWTGDLSPFDADNSSPSADWQLFDLFTTAFNDNATRGQLSVNVGAPNGPSLAAWSALFSGVVVVTNTAGGYTVIQPAGPADASSFLGTLVTNINQTRATFTNADGLVGSFEHVGDILATPDLTVSNPWLLQNNNTNTINDEMYEWLPQQTLSLLRVSGTPQSPMRYVIYCYGQTLKPAPNGIVTSGAEFGLCTNYQVVAEAATRAVVQFDSVVTNSIFPPNDNNAPIVTNIWTSVPSVTNNSAVIKSFNVLPPN